MKAIVNEGIRSFVVKDVREPRPEPDEVLLKPLYNGICFTDKHVYEGLPRRGGYNYNARIPEGQIFGHEFSAEVVEVGDAVDDLVVGQRVVVDPRLRCGDCRMCRAGLMGSCERMRGSVGFSGRRPDGRPYQGGAAEYTAVPAYSCYVLPDSVSDLLGCGVEPLCCGTRALRLAGVTVGDNVVFLGAEDYNMGAAQWVANLGPEHVAVVDPVEVRRQTAAELGVSTLDPASDDLVEQLQEKFPLGVDWVFVASESYIPESFEYLAHAVRIARVQGTVIMNRFYGPETYERIAPHTAWIKELTIRHFGNFWGEEPARGGRARGDYAVAIEALASGVVNQRAHHPEIVSLDELDSAADVAEVFEGMPGNAHKTVLKIWGD